jgi:hypothetical protein
MAVPTMAGPWASAMQQRLMSPDLIHVAAANENCGRVVLAMPNGPLHVPAVETALTLARAFEASLETLLIECPRAAALTAHSFAREISHAGRIGKFSISSVTSSHNAMARDVEKTILARVSGRGVQHAFRRVDVATGEAIRAACQEQGPWNMVVLGEPKGSLSREGLHRIFSDSQGATGIVVVGENVTQAHGDVIVVVDDAERLSQMVRAAQRIAAVLARGKGHKGVVRLLLAAATAVEGEELEGVVRLALPPTQSAGAAEIAIEAFRANFGTHAEIAEALRRLDGAFVVARHGSAILPQNGEADSLSAVLRAPLLLVR